MSTFTPSIVLPQLPELITGIRLAPDGGYLYVPYEERAIRAPVRTRLSNSLDAGLRVWDINAFFEGESRCVKLMRGHTVGEAASGEA